MGKDLMEFREEVMDRADRAIDAAWPERKGEAYVNEMMRAASEMERIAATMKAEGFDRIEQSHTHRLLGSLYADLAPALGNEMLARAVSAYRAAEELLEGQSDELERAKLDFNFGNALRQVDPNDAGLLQEAKRRLLAARATFLVQATQFLPQVDAALKSVESLLALAPLAREIDENTKDMSALQEKLAAGGNVSEIAEETRKVMSRHGGVAGMIGRLQAVIDTLSDEQRQSAKFEEVRRQMEILTNQALGGKEVSPEIREVWSLLNEKLKYEAESGKVSKERAETLKGVLEEYGRALSGDEEHIGSLLRKVGEVSKFIQDRFEMAHYLSHGLDRPPEGSRASDLVELSWVLRRNLLEEMNRPEKGEDESREALELNMRASRVDRRIYEAGADDVRAVSVERDELRPLALAIREFSARAYTMPSRPIWRSASIPIDTNAVFYSGGTKRRRSVSEACSRIGLEVMAEPSGEFFADARWKQLQKAFITVFNLCGAHGQRMASVMYELGVALTLGKPAVVLVEEGQTIPFDVGIEPLVMPGEMREDLAVAVAIDKSVVWLHPAPWSGSPAMTLEHVLSVHQRPQQNVYADQSLRILAELRKAPDPLAITHTLSKFFEYLADGKTMLIHPWWAPVYPEEDKPSLFHVMPFGPKWADRVTDAANRVCEKSGVRYVRGDMVPEPDVIRSIWEELARAAYVLVDLTGLNANVALELGIAHTMGKKLLMVGQGDPGRCVFGSISKLRVGKYDVKKLDQTLGKEVIKLFRSA